MTLNAEDNGTRRIISIQLPENLEEKYNNAPKSEKAKIKKTIDFLDASNRTHSLDEIGQERIIRAAKKIKEEYPKTDVDLGFKHYTLHEVNQTTIDKMEKFDDSVFVTSTPVFDDFGINTILTTWLIHDGYGFFNNAMQVEFDGYTAYWCKNHLYFINPHLTENAIKTLVDKYNTQGDFNPQNIILFGYNFNFTETENLKINIRTLHDSEKNLKINLDIRY